MERKMYMTEEESDKSIIPRRKYLQQILENKGVTPSTLYNEHKNVLFYQNLPKSL